MYRVGDDFGFIAHPRTASRTTRDMLCHPKVGAVKVAGHHNVDEAACKDIMSKGGVIVCTVRNMFDVIVSWYYNQHFNHEGDPLNKTIVIPTFKDYVLGELIPKPKHRWFQVPIFHYGLPWCKVRLRYENLQADLSNLISHHGYEVPPMGHVGLSVNKTDYHDYYDDETRRAVERRWAEDLQLTGYSFDD